MWVRLLWIALLCCSFSFAQKNDRRRVTSTAQQKQEVVKDKLETSIWKTGNLFFSPLLGLRQLGYDSNVFSSETARVDDFAIAPQVGINVLFRPNSRWVWENSVSYDYLYYADLENLRGSQYQGETRLYGFFKRSSIDFGIGYNRDRQRLNSEIKDHVYSERLKASLNYNVALAARHQLDFKLGANRLQYDETAETEQFQVLDRSDSNANVRYSYKAKEWFLPFVELEQQKFNFKTDGNIRDNTEFDGLFFGVATQGKPRLVMELKAGFQQLDFQPVVSRVAGPDGTPTDGPLIDLDEKVFAVEGNMRYRITRRYYMDSSVLRTPLFSLNESYLSFLSSKLTLEVGIETRRKYRIGPEISYGVNSYQNSFDKTLTTEREDDLKGIGFNFTIPVRKIYEWQVSVGYEKRDSNLPNRSDEGFRLSTSLGYK